MGKNRQQAEPTKQRRPTQSRQERPVIESVDIPDFTEDSDDESISTPKTNKPTLASQPSLSRISKGKIEQVAKSIDDVYTIGKELGSGAFSVVKACTHKESGEEFAVKII